MSKQLICKVSAHPSPRVRHMLNVLALSPQVAPVHDTLALVDITQSLCYRPYCADGSAPTIATNTKLWSMQHAKQLSLGQVAELMGHTLTNESFKGISRTAQLKLIGNSIHVATIGSLLMAVIAMACPS